MPEGPEIRLAADAVAAAIVGHNTDEVFFAFEHLKEFEPLLAGEMVTAVETRGKAILTRFANHFNVYSHNQLYGVWMVRQAHDYPETKRQLRLAIHNATKSALLYSASEIEVLRDDELTQHPFLSKIGPDLLDSTVSIDQIVERFQDERFRRQKLTSLLLDQHFLAGTGNYLRSEILHYAAVSPAKRPIDCSPEEIWQLAEGAILLTRQSYETRGITNEIVLAESLKNEGWSWGDYRWRVFRRGGQTCHRCGGTIVRDKIGGRRLDYCGGCQKE